MSHEFNATLYNTRNAMLAAIAEAWMTAHGQNDPATVDEIGCSSDGQSEAAECIYSWGLDQDGEPDPSRDDAPAPSHMKANGYSQDDLAAAILEFWHTRPDRDAA